MTIRPHNSTHITWPANMPRGLSLLFRSKISVPGMLGSAEGQCPGQRSSAWYQYNREQLKDATERRHDLEGM